MFQYDHFNSRTFIFKIDKKSLTHLANKYQTSKVGLF